MTAPEEDEFSDVVDAVITRVDMVGKGANGMPFLIAKNQGGILPPETVRDLLKRAEPDAPESVIPQRDDITMTGSPSAIAKMIHEAPMRPGNVFASMTAAAAQYQSPLVKDDMDADVAVGDLMGDGATLSDSVPGSADWENMDGDTAMNALAVLGRIQAIICWLADREAAEAVTNDPGDAENVWNLEDAGCAVQCAIDTLAAFAAGEKLEASLEDEMEAVGKAAAPLAVLEGLVPLVKAGRVLSATNEQALRGAAEAIQTVLASLPAPVTDEAAPVAKNTEEPAVAEVPVKKAVDEPTEPTAAATTPQNTPEAADTPDTEDPKTADPAPVAKSNVHLSYASAMAYVDENEGASIRKAKGDPQMAVFDASGKLVGTIDPTDLSPIAAPTPPEGGDEQAAPADDTAPPTDSSDAPPADTTPADPATVGTPSGDTPAPDEDVQKSELVKAVDTVKAEFEEKLAAQSQAYELLKGEFDAFKVAPARARVLTNGALPPPHLLRGQALGASVDSDRVAELQKLSKNSADPAVRSEAIRELNDGAQATWKAMLSGQ